MKKSVLIFSIPIILMLMSISMFMPANVKAGPPVYKFEYVTGLVPMSAETWINIYFYNHGEVDGLVSYAIYIGEDMHFSQDETISPGKSSKFGTSYTLIDDREFWVSIKVSSELITPTVTFGSELPFFKPIEQYKPSDFTVFKLLKNGKKVRIR
jgi:hypothetical protein